MGIDPAADALTLDHELCDARLHGRRLGLTPREFLLLATLVAAPRGVITSERLLEAMWGAPSIGDHHVIEVYVSRLRGKLGETGAHAQIIQTVRGRGYMYVPPDAAAQTVRLAYDRNLILRGVAPDDRPFLGWNPAEVLDTFFMLTNVTRIHSSRRTALAVARLWTALGLETWEGPLSVRRADGSVTHVTADIHVLTSSRRFRGLQATIHL